MNTIAASNAGTSTVGSVNRFQEMKTEDFVRIIFTELSNQDPFQPQDSGALLEQLNSIRSIESDIELTNRLDALVRQNELAAAGSLVGKTVVGLTEGAARAEGRVAAAARAGDAVLVQLENGQRIPFAQIESIAESAPVV